MSHFVIKLIFINNLEPELFDKFTKAKYSKLYFEFRQQILEIDNYIYVGLHCMKLLTQNGLSYSNNSNWNK